MAELKALLSQPLQLGSARAKSKDGSSNGSTMGGIGGTGGMGGMGGIGAGGIINAFAQKELASKEKQRASQAMKDRMAFLKAKRTMGTDFHRGGIHAEALKKEEKKYYENLSKRANEKAEGVEVPDPAGQGDKFQELVTALNREVETGQVPQKQAAMLVNGLSAANKLMSRMGKGKQEQMNQVRYLALLVI